MNVANAPAAELVGAAARTLQSMDVVSGLSVIRPFNGAGPELRYRSFYQRSNAIEWGDLEIATSSSASQKATFEFHQSGQKVYLRPRRGPDAGGRWVPLGRMFAYRPRIDFCVPILETMEQTGNAEFVRQETIATSHPRTETQTVVVQSLPVFMGHRWIPGPFDRLPDDRVTTMLHAMQYAERDVEPLPFSVSHQVFIDEANFPVRVTADLDVDGAYSVSQSVSLSPEHNPAPFHLRPLTADEIDEESGRDAIDVIYDSYVSVLETTLGAEGLRRLLD